MTDSEERLYTKLTKLFINLQYHVNRVPTMVSEESLARAARSYQGDPIFNRIVNTQVTAVISTLKEEGLL